MPSLTFPVKVCVPPAATFGTTANPTDSNAVAIQTCIIRRRDINNPPHIVLRTRAQCYSEFTDAIFELPKVHELSNPLGGRGQRDLYCQGRTLCIGMNVEITAEFMHSFPHTDEPNAEVTSACVETFQHIGRHAEAKVSYPHRHNRVINIDLNFDFRTARVTMNVGKTFLQYAEKSDFHRPWQASQTTRKIKSDRSAAAL